MLSIESFCCFINNSILLILASNCAITPALSGVSGSSGITGIIPLVSGVSGDGEDGGEDGGVDIDGVDGGGLPVSVVGSGVFVVSGSGVEVVS